MSKNNTYEDAGVNIDNGNKLIENISSFTKQTNRAGNVGGIGGFAGLFDLSVLNYQQPMLVAATDGVGTKLRVAIETGLLDFIGQDLVAMCANDLVVQGAEPLFFLDYYATGKLDVDQATTVIKSIAKACKQINCSLLGGETAEMPTMYHDGDFDLAGFCVGIVEKGNVLTGQSINAGDVLIGVASSGVHANGFSLVRKILAQENINYSDPCPFIDDNRTWAEVLLEPTTLYVNACLELHRANLAKGFCHITGGGFSENLPRVLPHGLGAKIFTQAWHANQPEIFTWLAKTGGIIREEMFRVFNNGIGMIVITNEHDYEDACLHLDKQGLAYYNIGNVDNSGVVNII